MRESVIAHDVPPIDPAWLARERAAIGEGIVTLTGANRGVEPTWGRSGCDRHLTCVQSAVYDSSSHLEDAAGALW